MSTPDHNERRKIVEQLDATMIVEAAAGTGKTTAMVDRMVELLQTGKCRAETLAAMTFTVKAAGELRERFREKLGDPARADACTIGTVHSFCARLLRERPVEAGVDPDFAELDEQGDDRMRERSWETFVNELYAADDPVLDELETLGLTLADLRDAFLQFAEYPDVEDWPAPTVPAPEITPALKHLRAYAAHLEKTLPSEEGTDALIPLVRQILRMMKYVDLKRTADLAELFAICKGDRKCVQKCWPGGKETALREHERWNKFVAEVAEPFVARWREHRYPTVVRLLQRARAVYDRQRAEARVLNFQDLLMRAARLLRDQPEIRQYFRRRFTHVLVDEFQDTDPVQAEVLLLLTADNPREHDWRKCKPVPGSLFVVGDPKQSIYRFRRADIVTYNTVKEIIVATGGTCVSLTANFRCAEPVVKWVNETFQSATFFPAVVNEFSPAYAPLQFSRKDKARDPGIFKIVITGKNQADNADEEADQIARRILASGRPPGDFLVIARKTARLSVYAGALRNYGIPHAVTGGSSLNEVRELGLLHAVLRAAIEPDNPVALVAALRSELFGCSDRELYAFKRAGGRFDYRRDGLEAFATVKQCAQWLAQLTPMIAIERIVAHLGLMSLAAADSDASAGSLGKALEILRAAQAELPTATDLVALLWRLSEKSEKHDGASATAPSDSVVRVMNLHKVKGLEAKVVFLADPAGESEHEVPLHVDRKKKRVTGWLAVYGEKPGRGKAPLLAHPPKWDELAAREDLFKAAEENRLLYVAATRPRDQIIVSLRANDTKRNPWQRLEAGLHDAPELPAPDPQPSRDVKLESVAAADVAAARDAIATRRAAILVPTYAARAAKPDSASVSSGAAGDGAQWGSVIHLLMQTAMSRPVEDPESVAKAALAGEGLPSERAGEAVAIVERVMKSAMWQRALAAKRRLTETPFFVCLADENGTLVRGVIDLAFEEADGWVIVDYKTDRGRVEKLLATYREQLQTYRKCWQTITGQPVKEVGLFATKADRYAVLPP